MIHQIGVPGNIPNFINASLLFRLDPEDLSSVKARGVELLEINAITNASVVECENLIG